MKLSPKKVTKRKQHIDPNQLEMNFEQTENSVTTQFSDKEKTETTTVRHLKIKLSFVLAIFAIICFSLKLQSTQSACNSTSTVAQTHNADQKPKIFKVLIENVKKASNALFKECLAQPKKEIARLLWQSISMQCHHLWDKLPILWESIISELCKYFDRYL